MEKKELSAPFIGIVRHRLATDGHGVTTLVAFHGCPLRCNYCLNPQCLNPAMVWRDITTSQLLDELMLDNLYFLATGGGVTFGGGEPLLHSEFIDEFNAALIADRIDLSFANAYRDAQEIVEYRKHSVGNIIDILKIQFNKLLTEIGAVDVNELVTTVKNGDVDKLIEKYGESERFKEVVTANQEEQVAAQEK